MNLSTQQAQDSVVFYTVDNVAKATEGGGGTGDVTLGKRGDVSADSGGGEEHSQSLLLG